MYLIIYYITIEVMTSLKQYNNKGEQVDWYDASSAEVPKHNQKDQESGYYWNEFIQ